MKENYFVICSILIGIIMIYMIIYIPGPSANTEFCMDINNRNHLLCLGKDYEVDYEVEYELN